MVPANDFSSMSNVIQIRRTLQKSVAQLMDAQDYIVGQVAALQAIERQVRALALRESAHVLEAEGQTDDLDRLSDLQTATNANFRQMQDSYAGLRAQILTLMGQHEQLYNSTFVRSTCDPDPASFSNPE
ncbi:hypothetical protein ASG63_23740 [Methylobacterium sp. Leaf94]|nr:hypothetical protein ASG63_23740 [Methylobacterium sp. Leaf94]